MELFVSFSEILRFFKRNLWKFAAAVVACGILFGAVSLRNYEEEYSATSTILIACTIDDNASPDYSNQYASMLNVRLQAAIAMAPSLDLKQAVAERAGVEESEINAITAQQITTSTLIEITVSTGEREKAAMLADAAAEQIGEEIEAIYPTPPIQVHITDHAVEPDAQSPTGAAVKSAVLGMAMGLVLSLCVGVAVLLLDHTIRNGAYVAQSLKIPFLGSLRANAAGEKAADEYRKLRAAVTQQVGEKGSILLTPVKGKKGAAPVAAGLGRVFTLTGKSVLLVEADFSGSGLGQQLGASGGQQGLAQVLTGKCALAEAVSSTGGQNLFFLSAGSGAGSSADLLASQAFPAFLKEAAAAYDYVLCVLPSEEKMPDADSAAHCADGVVLVAEYGVTPYHNFQESLMRLHTAGGKVAGFVLNGVK